jgi:hypothetical protein
MLAAVDMSAPSGKAAAAVSKINANNLEIEPTSAIGCRKSRIVATDA